MASIVLGLLLRQCHQDALQHLMNYVWPNIFENSPHLIMARPLGGAQGWRNTALTKYVDSWTMMD